MATGRPTKLDDAVAKDIIEAVRAGNTLRASAEAAGISWTAFKEWRVRGRDGEEPYATFAAGVKQAEAEAEKNYVRIIKKAADEGAWQAGAWWLERRRHRAYGRKDRVDTRVSHIETMSDADLARKHKALLSEAEKEFGEDGEAEANKRARGG